MTTTKPPRETAAQKRTRIGMLLADYDAQNRALRKAQKDVESLKAQIKEIEPGTYGDWVRGEGTPREITDQEAVKMKYMEMGWTLPTKMTDPPITVTPKVGK
jgi:hypothetical protein